MRRIAAAALCALTGCLQAPPASPEDTPPDGCGRAGALEDEFDGTSLDGELWEATGGVSAGGGDAVIASGPGVHDALESAAHYRVSGSQLVAQLDVSGLGDALLIMALETLEDHQVAITLQDGELGFRVIDGAGERTLDNAPLAEDAIWWRLREEDGQFFWATSGNGADWGDERGPFAAAIGDLARVEFQLQANVQDSRVTIHAVNPGSAERYCPAASIQDDFTELSARWLVDEQGDCEITVMGQAELAYSTQAFCALTTRELFDLRDSAFAVELARVDDCVPQPIMRVTIGEGDAIQLKCVDQGGTRRLVGERNGADAASVVYVEEEHRFVQVRHDSGEGEVLFESSRGDGDWSLLGSLPVAAGLVAETSLRFYLGGETSGGLESVAFDALNEAP